MILIMPTWREGLVGKTIGKGNDRLLNESFYQSEYANKWKEILHSSRLKELAEDHQLKVIFFPHVNVSPYLSWFDLPKHIEVVRHSGSQSIQQFFLKAKIMVTDYSSVAFEMAFLKKPVLYYQFDKEHVFSGGHLTDKGYFDYTLDGFGPAFDAPTPLLNELEVLLSKKCKQERKYLERQEKAFCFRDANNCKRTFEAILNLNNPG